MLTRLTNFIRSRFHPLHALRKSDLFVKRLMPLLDFPVACNLWRVRWKVHARLVRNFTFVFASKSIEPGVGSLFISLARTLKPHIFWDIGANIGQHSWILMTESDQLQAVLFEPDPDNAWLIEKTIETNKLTNARLIRRAVSNATATALFSVDKASSATGSLIVDNSFSQKHYGRATATITVNTLTIDQAWMNEGIQPPDVMKIDVELAEHLVFEGASEVLKRFQPIIVFECGGENRSSILRTLSELNYTVLGADEPDIDPAESINLLALPERCISITEQLISTWRSEFSRWETG